MVKDRNWRPECRKRWRDRKRSRSAGVAGIAAQQGQHQQTPGVGIQIVRREHITQRSLRCIECWRLQLEGNQAAEALVTTQDQRLFVAIPIDDEPTGRTARNAHVVFPKVLAQTPAAIEQHHQTADCLYPCRQTTGIQGNHCGQRDEQQRRGNHARRAQVKRDGGCGFHG